MWFLIGLFRCAACDALKSVADRARRSPFKRGFGVCRTCYEGWERRGRRCTRCWGEVKATQVLAFFTERNAFGHLDCGGAQLA